MQVADAERVALAGGEPARELVLGLLAEIAVLRERVDEHERLLKRDSTNSLLAPSNDPPLTRQQRRALARERAKKSLQAQGREQREAGGQPGHEGNTRELAAPDRLDGGFEHVPVACGCGHRFNGSEERTGDPVAHQKWELAPIVPLIFEHRLHRLVAPSAAKRRSLSCPTG